jgi:hypothetical protein
MRAANAEDHRRHGAAIRPGCPHGPAAAIRPPVRQGWSILEDENGTFRRLSFFISKLAALAKTEQKRYKIHWDTGWSGFAHH